MRGRCGPNGGSKRGATPDSCGVGAAHSHKIDGPWGLPYKPGYFFEPRRPRKFRLCRWSEVTAHCRFIQARAAETKRRTDREADLSTEQTGAQAPSRLPDPHGDQGRPQGAQRPPVARPQAAERLKRANCPWNDCGNGRISFESRRGFESRQRLSCCRPGGASTVGRRASASRCRRRSAMPSSATAFGVACGRSCGFRTRPR
jgi:hypothetical protein